MQRARIWERLPRMLCAYGIMGLPAILLWMFRISEKESGGVPKTKHTARNNARRSQPYRSASSIPRKRMPHEVRMRLEMRLPSVPSYLSLRYTTSPMPTCARILAHSLQGKSVT